MATSKKCIRCSGKKKVYRCGLGGYSQANMGGEEISCPNCAGLGFIEIPEFVEKAKEEIKQKRKYTKSTETIAEDADVKTEEAETGEVREAQAGVVSAV